MHALGAFEYIQKRTRRLPRNKSGPKCYHLFNPKCQASCSFEWVDDGKIYVFLLLIYIYIYCEAFDIE